MDRINWINFLIRLDISYIENTMGSMLRIYLRENLLTNDVDVCIIRPRVGIVRKFSRKYVTKFTYRSDSK